MAISAIIRFTKFSFPVMGGGEVQVKIRKCLLNPLERNIAGILHLGGQNIYIPQNGQICIGSSRKCDIRIKDPLIENMHALLIDTPEGIQITNLADHSIALKSNSSGEIKEISSSAQETNLSDKDTIVFGLRGRNGGNGRYLSFSLEIPKPITEDIRFLLAQRPSIEEISAERLIEVQEQQAMVRTFTEENNLIVAGKLDPALVKGTEFSEVKTLEGLLDIYFYKYGELNALKNKIEKKREVVPAVCIMAAWIGAGLLAVLGLQASPWGFAPIGIGCTALIPSIRDLVIILKSRKRLSQLESTIGNILSNLESNGITRLLSSRTTGEIEHIIRILKDANFEKAAEVKKILREAAESAALPQAETPAPAQIPESTEV